MSTESPLASKIDSLLTAWGLASSTQWLGPLLLIAAVLLVAAVNEKRVTSNQSVADHEALAARSVTRGM